MSLPRLTICIFLLHVGTLCLGQQHEPEVNRINPYSSIIKLTDSGKYIITYNQSGCKGYIAHIEFIPNLPTPPTLERISSPILTKHKAKFLTIHGNISYDFFYRSAIDTPVSQRNFQQHTEKIYLNVVVKEQYPLRVNFISRQSNSPYFRDFVDFNFQFDKYAHNKNLKQKVIDKLKSQGLQYLLYNYPDLAKLQADLEKQKERFKTTKTWLEDPSTLQKIIEERERNYLKRKQKEKDSANAILYNTQTGTFRNVSDSVLKISDSIQTLLSKAKSTKDKISDSLQSVKAVFVSKKDSIAAGVVNKIDSIAEPYAKLYEKRKQELDSLTHKIESTKKKVDSIQQVAEKGTKSLRQKIAKATSEKELRKLAEENCIDVARMGKLNKILTAIKTVNIGRSMLDYTELTAQNISITGLNIEYNPSYYVAIAAGKIDYRFRDFYNKGSSKNNQYILMGRVGIGNVERKALIFSYFTGRKNTSSFSLADSVKNYVNIAGYSLEAIYRKDENTSLSAEFAKSTKPVTGNLQANKQSNNLLRFSDESNMGINIKAQTIIRETDTRLSGFYRKTGENFQSFSLFSYNTDQTAWLMRIDQSFLKNKVTLSGMLRRNDFSNPFTDKTYKTSTVFKSIMLNIRFPKYPMVSLGYYPGTQLYLIDKEKIRESAYYILNGSIVYGYFLKGVSMNSSFVFNRYTNEATDSGFVAYKGVNYYGLQSIFFKKIQLQGGYSYTKQPELQFYTIEASGDYALRNWLRIGAGVKYNDVAGGKNYWGERATLFLNFKKFGIIQFQYEKSFLPTINQTLYPVEIGRASYFKSF